MTVASLDNNNTAQSTAPKNYFTVDTRGWRHYNVADITNVSQARYIEDACDNEASTERFKMFGIAVLGVATFFLTLELVDLITEVSIVVLALLFAPLEAASAPVFLGIVIVGSVGISLAVGIMLVTEVIGAFAEWFNEKSKYVDHLDSQALKMNLRMQELESHSSVVRLLANAANASSLSSTDREARAV